MRNISTNLIYIVLLLISCQGQPGNSPVEVESTPDKALNESILKSYMKAYAKLKNEALSMLKTMNDQKDLSGNAQFSRFEQIIKENGFSSVAEFEIINLKTAHLFKMNQVVRTNTLVRNKSEIKYQKEISMLEKLLQDPVLSESAIKEIKEAISELKKLQSEISEKNPIQAKKTEDDLIEQYNQKNKLKISKAELKLVASFEQELAETFQDMTIPANSENN